MKPTPRIFFVLNRRDQRALIVLCSIIIMLLFIPSYIRRNTPDDIADPSVFEKEIKKLSTPPAPLTKDSNVKIARFAFDPNEASEADLINLGMNKSLIKRVINYRSKGGHFKTKEDLLKIYGFPLSLFAQLKPYIKIPSVVLQNLVGNNASRSITKEMIEINSADSSLLCTLKGIGPVKASRILKYRARLGGFYKVDQLSEVYGLDSSLIETIRPLLKVDTTLIRRLPINTINTKELNVHPYFRNWGLINALINYRNVHGKFMLKADLKKCKMIDPDVFNKIQPYISLE